MKEIEKIISELANADVLLSVGRSFGLTINATENAVKQLADSANPAAAKVLANVFRELPRTAIYKTLNAERDAQDAEWGGQQHDQDHTPNDWIAYITKHAGKAAGGNDFRAQMVKVAALAVAAIEAHDANSTQVAESISGNCTTNINLNS